MPTKIYSISMTEEYQNIHKEFFGDHIYDNDLFLFFYNITKKKDDNTTSYYIRKSTFMTAMPMINVKNYLQSPTLYVHIDSDSYLRGINQNIMKENPDKIFDILCNECIPGITEKNITQRKTNVNYKKVWIFCFVANTNAELFSELDVFFRSVFDTFEKEDKSELKKCMKYSNIFLFFDITAESKKKVHASIIYNIEKYGSYISFIGVGGAFRNHGIGSFLLMLVQLHLKLERKNIIFILFPTKNPRHLIFTRTGNLFSYQMMIKQIYRSQYTMMIHQ